MTQYDTHASYPSFYINAHVMLANSTVDYFNIFSYLASSQLTLAFLATTITLLFRFALAFKYNLSDSLLIVQSLNKPLRHIFPVNIHI